MAQPVRHNYTEIKALIPELRVAARDLVDGSAVSPDDLVQDALGVALRNWDQLSTASELKSSLLDVLREQARTRKPDLVKPA